MSTQIVDFQIDGEVYKVNIRRSVKSKLIRLQISNAKGLELILPVRHRKIDLTEFINSKKNWIKKHSHRLKNKKEKYFYLGKSVNIFEQMDLFSVGYKFNFNGNELFISCPSNSSGKKNELFDVWIRKKAEEYIPQRVAFLAQKHGFQYNKVTVRDAQTRWGSCSSKKRLSFSSKLMYFNYKVIDYVIIHELCHLIHLNHSKYFWGLVEEKMPMFKFYQKQLSDPLP